MSEESRLNLIEVADRINEIAGRALAVHYAILGIGSVMMMQETDCIAKIAVDIRDDLHAIADELAPGPDVVGTADSAA